MTGPAEQHGWFGLSIRTRLVAAMVLLVLTVITIGSVVTVQYDRQRLRDQLRADMASTAKVLSQDFAWMLVVDSPDKAADLVSKLEAIPEIAAVVLRSPDGQVLLDYQRSDAAKTQHLYQEIPVEYQGVTIGFAEFTVLESRLVERTRSMARLLAYLVPLMVVLSVLLSVYLQRFFTRPLMRLIDAIRTVSSTHDYSIRLPELGRGEYALLYSGFNEMMARVEAAAGDLSDQTERLQVTLESIGDGVVTTDPDGQLQYVNPAAQNICGMGADLVVGRGVDSVFRLYDANGVAIVNPVKGCLASGEVVTVVHDCNVGRPDGEQLPVQATAAPILGKEGELIGAIMVLVDVSQARALSDELGYRANHDQLTGLFNRFAFENALRDTIAKVRDDDSVHSLLFMDLDQFKVVNDTCGHAAGDELLIELAALFKTKKRAGDLLARMGGDEFVILLRHCPIAQAVHVAEEIRDVVAEYRFHWQDKTFDVGVSIGLVQVDQGAGDLQQVMSNVDSACYEAKEAGRNRVYVYQSDDEALVQRRGDMALVARLRRAIDEDHLRLHAQAIFDTRGDPRGCELLVRMQDGAELLAPGLFLPAAERYGMIEQIDRWVVGQAVAWLAEQPRPFEGFDFCTINVSGVSLGNPDFARHVHELLTGRSEVASSLCIEITETSAVRNLQKAREFMQSLGGLGVRFALDDFGTGMSSLAYLKHLPVDLVKIDGAFVRDIATDPVDHGMVRAINDIAQLMDKRTVAEFVEDQAILEMLSTLGVDYAQGYHLGRPVPLDDLPDSLVSASP